MSHSFMSPEKKARREADLEKMRARNLQKKRGGRPRRIEAVDSLTTIVSQPVVIRPAQPRQIKPSSLPDIPPTFAGTIAAFQRNPRK
jgi:hypothetical protein